MSSTDGTEEIEKVEKGLPDEEIEKVEKGLPDKDTHHYVDYIPPDHHVVLPPPKWKLWVIVWINIYLTIWTTQIVNMVPWCMDKLNMSLNGAEFVMLAVVVAVILYGQAEIMVLVLSPKIGDKQYGVIPWMKKPRVQWVKESNNVFVEGLAWIVKIFEDGFEIFKPRPEPPPPPKQYESAKPEHEDGEVTLRIESHVIPDQIDNYKKMVDKFMNKDYPIRTGMKHIMTNFDKDPEDGVYVWYITFSSIDHLNDFMLSPVRKGLVKRLQPLLVTKSLEQLTQERELPDVLTDFMVPHSEPAPKLHPKKWKIYVIITMSVWWTNMIVQTNIVQKYFVIWGLEDSNPRAKEALTVTFISYINFHAMVPFLSLLFGWWLKRKDDEIVTKVPWRYSTEGFPMLGKCLVLAAFYIPCVVYRFVGE